ncbi:MAG: hypothetical protein HFI11_07225 [Lachnospiraceae bacterium]|nr:hypothetical protein [Lachnospiraceae bacterium]
MKAGWKQKILFFERQNMRIGDQYTGMSGHGRKPMMHGWSMRGAAVSCYNKVVTAVAKKI